jgi:glycosyltransferase involved in cell wall biosynthesis
MKLSIIVPCFNVEDHITRCLNSLVNQDLNSKDFEIIIIDDGSTDNSINLVNKFISKHKNAVLYAQENKGLGAVRNRGIKLAKGDYIYFIDSDDYLAHHTLNIVLDKMINNNLDLLGFETTITTKLDLFSSKTRAISKEIEISTGIDYLIANKLHRTEAWWYVIKREYLIKSGFQFDEGRFLEDIIFTFKILMHAKRFLYLPLDVHRYYKNPNSIMNNESPEHLRKLIESYRKMIFSLHVLMDEILIAKTPESQKLANKINFISSLNTCFIFFKIIRSNYTIKNTNDLLKKLNTIGAYPFDRQFTKEGYGHYKIVISSYIFNKKYLFYILLYPLRVLYKNRAIGLP